MATAFRIYNTASGRLVARHTRLSRPSEHRAGKVGHGSDDGDLHPHIR